MTTQLHYDTLSQSRNMIPVHRILRNEYCFTNNGLRHAAAQTIGHTYYSWISLLLSTPCPPKKTKCFCCAFYKLGRLG